MSPRPQLERCCRCGSVAIGLLCCACEPASDPNAETVDLVTADDLMAEVPHGE